jgi:hypothetical protein
MPFSSAEGLKITVQQSVQQVLVVQPLVAWLA